MKVSQAFTECGSDKDTCHSYGFFYDRITEENRIRSVLEIGVFMGAGLAAWKMHNPAIEVLGVDKECLSKFPTIITTTPDYLSVVQHCRKHQLQFDLIIDDGCHEEDSQILGLYCLREFLTPSGIYVIEDMQDQDPIDRMSRVEGCTIIDLRQCKGRYDDVLAVWTNPEGKL